MPATAFVPPHGDNRDVVSFHGHHNPPTIVQHPSVQGTAAILLDHLIIVANYGVNIILRDGIILHRLSCMTSKSEVYHTPLYESL